jgi:anaerobic magnesium-protoporphyrin IX monomethyl ester cyclase
MKVALVFPPQGHFTQPYLSLPSLAAWLRHNGVGEVEQLDESIEAYDHFLSPARLRRSLERVRAGEGLARLEARSGLGFSEMERYQTLSEIALIGDEVAERIDEAKRVLRTPSAFYDYERYLWAGRTVEQALRLISAEFAPTRLTAHGFVMPNRIERSAEIVAALGDEQHNPFVEYFSEHTLPRLKRLDPDLIGLSVTFPSQAIPAFTLARLIKQWKPDVHITIGGGLLAYTADKLARRGEVWGLIDSMVLLEGEGPLLQLCEAVERGDRDLSPIHNLVWRDDRGALRKNDQAQPLDIKQLPVPDFDGLPLDKYLSPELVLPLAATRGCYWGKCVFCTLYQVIGPGYRGRTIEQTVEDMSALKTKYGVSKFYLAIEDLPPTMARKLPRAILDAKLDVKFWADARLEHEVFTQDVCDELAEAGCLRLAFGYESSSRRVLEKMCKGIDPEESLEVVRRVRRSGISVTLYVMVGFPTETRAEARATLETILANRDAVQEVSVRVFYLDERSEVFKRASEFAIEEVFPDPEADLQVYYDFRASEGMTRREAREAYLEFTRELRSHFPVFQNTNMLYHELKSHYFLYLAQHGSWERLVEEVLERPAQPSRDGRPRARGKFVSRELAFDRGSIDARLASIDSHTLRPRYQSDLVEDADRARFDRELAPEPRSESVLLYAVDAGEVHALSPAAAELLARCDGRRELEEVLAPIPAPHRADALRCLTELAAAGLITPLPEEVHVR